MDSRMKGNDSNPNASSPDQPKRRACDECRARKLACSKEVDGCARCKREGIRCNYSVQKPMGRPRKRPRGEIDAEAEAKPEAEADTHNLRQSDKNTTLRQVEESHIPLELPLQGPELDLNPFDFDFNLDPTVGMDLDLSFLDMDNPNLDFFDLVQTQDFPSSLSIPPDDYMTHQQPNNGHLSDPDPKVIAMAAPESHQYNPQEVSWYTGNLASINIDFNPSPQPPPPPRAPEFTPEEAAAFIASLAPPESPENKPTPSLSPDDDSSGSSTPESPEPEPHDSAPLSEPTLLPSDVAGQATQCACFSKLYLALESLQHLPSDFDSAMAVTRNASKTAYQTVICPVCGDPPLDMHFRTGSELTHDFWLRPFQNNMMLGALLPSLSNAYVRILKMVDTEASKAEAENRKIVFKLEEYGGVWGRAAEEHVHCSMALSIEGVHLEPSMWRMIARALLKFDVYGVSRVGEAPIPGVEDERPFVQIGLKDIMNMMEERSKRRHEQMDALVASGKLTMPSNYYNHPAGVRAHEGGKPQCMVILDLAKKSMADLVIP